MEATLHSAPTTQPNKRPVNTATAQGVLVESFDPRLGNIAQSSSSGEKSYKFAQKQRYAMHRQQRNLLPDEKALAGCSLHARPFTGHIDCNVNLTRKDAFFGGLKHCDSPNCVQCAPRRAEEDRQELTVALAQCQQMGYQVFHVVFTMSHHWHMTLESQRDAMNETLAAVHSGDWHMSFAEKFGYVGRVRVTEAPFGENGWHVHTHMMLILNPAAGEYADQDAEQVGELLAAHLWPRYMAQLAKRDFTADQVHGLTVQVGHSSLAAYVAKYGRDPALGNMSGLENEMTGFFSKTGGHDSLTPFELLAASMGDDAGLLARLDGVSNRHYSEAQLLQLAAELFIEYFRTFKGKPRLVWSKGLWDALAMDEALAWFELNQQPDEIETLAYVEAQTGWKKVRGADGGEDLRPDLLAEIVTGDITRVRAFLERHGIEAIYPDGNLRNPDRDLRQGIEGEMVAQGWQRREQQKWFGGHAVPGGASVPFARSECGSAQPNTLIPSPKTTFFGHAPRRGF